MSPFAIATLGLWLATVGAAAAARGRMFATFLGVMLGVHGLIAVGLWSTWSALGLGGAAVFLQAVAFVHFLSLLRPALRPLPWRLVVSWPAHWFVGATFLAFPWAIAAALGVHPHGWWLPYLLAVGGMWQSLRTPWSTVHLSLDQTPVPGLQRHGHGSARERDPLRVVQISDPHLGPFMSVARLRAIAERAVAAQPDLVLLTGDFLTMESKGTPGCLAEALAPLQALEGRTFACFGNHDHESPRAVRAELAAVGVRLLVDEHCVVQTACGPVQLVGCDFRWRDRDTHLAELFARVPRVEGAQRLVLLHDPGAFKHVPEGEGDLVLSGHTHGGQVGLVSFGGTATAVSASSSMPDHGFWARGPDRMYVHRATGHYGFPLRMGVPGEEGVIYVHRVSGPRT